MPRPVRDLDEEIDVKPGRKTRALADATSGVDSPLRRSTRSKTSVKQYGSSPDSPLSDASNVSSTQTKRVTRRRTIAMDSVAPTENHRTLRSRINSISSDVSEIVELDITTPTSKTKSSGINDAATKTNSRRSKRLTRAGSETKSPPPTRVTRATRATSVGPDTNSGSKITDRYNNELTGTPLKMKRRTSVLPTEATVLEEKEEFMKIAVVSLDRTLPNLKELKETESEFSFKSAEKDQSLSASKNKHNTTRQSINEEKAEDENLLRTSQNNSPEKDSSIDFEEVETHASVDDKEILEINTNTSEDGAKLSTQTEKEIELSADNESQIFSQSEHESMSKKLGLKHEDLLNKSMGRDENNSDKENVVVNVNDSETTDDVVLQSPKPIIAGSPNSEINLTPKRYSKELSKIAHNEILIQEVSSNKDVDNNLSTEIMDISDNEQDNSTNMEKLVVSIEAESIAEVPTSERSDKHISVETCTTSSSDDSLEVMECIDIEKYADYSTQINIQICEKSGKTHDKKDNEVQDVKSDISVIEKDMAVNVESGRYDISTGDKCDIIGENIESCKAGNLDEKYDEMSGIEVCSSANLSNAEPPKPSDVILVTATQYSVLDQTPSLQNGGEIKNIHSNTCIISDSSDVHLCPKDFADSNANAQDNVTDVIKNSQSSIVTDTFGESIEEVRELGEHAEKDSALDSSLTLNKQYIDEIESNEKDLNVNQETSKEKEKSMEIDDSDSDSNAEDLFQDIPASEWKEKNVGAVDKDSVHSLSTERLENESEGESDLILVDREAWLAMDNTKFEKEKETFDYDSDDTVVIKTEKDPLNSQNEKSPASYVMEDECMLNESKNRTSISKKRKSMELNEAKNKEDEMEDMEDTQDTENPVDVSGDKSIVKNSKTHATPKHKSPLRISSVDKSLCELHEQAEDEENISLNKSKLSEDPPKRRKSLSKSMQESNKIDECNIPQAVKKGRSLNKSNSEETEKSETESSNENVKSSSAKKSDKNQSLNSSIKKKMKPLRLKVISTDESDNDCKENNQERKGSSTRKKITKHYSTSVNIGSDSNESKNLSDSDDSRNRTVKLPKFLFGGSSDSNSEDNDGSNKSMDSDIEREYNLHGKSISKFSDDDVPGDECRASETESSDPDDNGSDLADFVVDDDEVEDEEDDENEEEDGECTENKELDTEDKKAEADVQADDRKVQLDTEMEVDEEMQLDESAEEEKESEDNKENMMEKSTSKAINASAKQKHKSRKSGDLNLSEITRSDKKKKKQQKDISQTRDDQMETSLADISLSIFETKKGKQKRASGEFTVEDIEQPLNESEFIFNKKLQKLNKSMECSTPKIHPSKREKLNVSMQMLHTSLEGIRKKQGNKSSEVKEDMISDKEESKNMMLNEGNISKTLNKTKVNETIMHRSLPSELIEIVTRTNLSRPMSSRMVELNKTTFIPESESPTTKYLKKEKLNESAPVLKLHAKFKKLDDINDSNEHGDQLEDQNEGLNEQNIEVVKGANESLKKKILKVADNLLETDQQKKRKKRKQSVVDIHDYVLSESLKINLHGINDSITVEESKKIVPSTNTDNKIEAIPSDKKRKKKSKTHNTANPVKEESCEEIAETQSVANDKNVFNEEKKKKKKKEKIVEAVFDSANQDQKLKIVKKKKKKVLDAVTSENVSLEAVFDSTNRDQELKIVKKKKKKVLDVVVPNENVSDEQQLSKKKLKKQKLISEDIISQDRGTSREKLSQKKKQLSLEDTVVQHEIVSNKEPFKKKKKLSNDSLQNENILVEALSTKKQKLHEGSKKGNVKCSVPNKLRESTNTSSEPHGKSKIRAFSKNLEETKVFKRSGDNIKATKEVIKKKQITERTRKENEIKIKKPEAKNQMMKTNKIEVQGKSIKRLPDEVLENIPDISAKPLKRRKISKAEDPIISLDSTFNLKSKEVRNIHIADDFTSPSVSGSTTEFRVINLRKMKKTQKRGQIYSYKQKMLARKKREPVSTYLMYLEKQKVSGKDK